MPSLYLKTENNILIENWVAKTNLNLLRNDLIRNPFSDSKVRLIEKEYGLFLTITMNPIYPNNSNFFFVLSGLSLLVYYFSSLLLFVYTAIIVAGVGCIIKFAHSNLFFKMMIKKALRKTGYKGRIEFLKITG